MATQAAAVNVPFGAVATLRVGSLVNTLFQAVIVWNDARLTRKALSELSNAQLEDIGLTRGDF